MKSLIFIWTMYTMGQAICIMLQANAVVRSKLNSVPDWAGYFQLRWVPIVARVFLNAMAFMFIWTNPHLAAIQDYMGSTFSQVSIAGIFGFFSDSLIDKVLTLFPWLQKEAPPATGQTPDKP